MNQKPFLIIVFIAFAMLCINKADAQKDFGFIHGLGAIPLDGSSKLYYNAGFGGEAGVGFEVAKTTYVTATVGYTSFSGKDSFPSETYVPVKVGLRQYFPSKVVFFNADLGAGFVSNSVATKETPVPSTTRFAADFGIGAKLTDIELVLDFNTFQEPKPDGWAGWLEFKVGYNFKL